MGNFRLVRLVNWLFVNISFVPIASMKTRNDRNKHLEFVDNVKIEMKKNREGAFSSVKKIFWRGGLDSLFSHRYRLQAYRPWTKEVMQAQHSWIVESLCHLQRNTNLPSYWNKIFLKKIFNFAFLWPVSCSSFRAELAKSLHSDEGGGHGESLLLLFV